MEKTFNIKTKTLTFKDSLIFIEEVVSAYFDNNEEGEITYLPFIGEIGRKNAFLKYYTDYEFSDNIEENYQFVSDFNICEYTKDINETQYNMLVDAINGEVNLRLEKLKYSREDVISQFVKSLTNKVNSIEIPKIDNEALGKVVDFLLEGHLDPDKIVDAYLQSDFHNKKTQELLEEKNNKIVELEEKIAKKAIKKAEK